MLTLSIYDDPKHPHYKEFLPVIDAGGVIKSVQDRVRVHQGFLLHPVVRCIMLTPDGQVIMQEKQLKSEELRHIKVLDTTVSGHIGGKQEDMEKLIGTPVFPLVMSTLQGEMEEEVGIKPAEEELLHLGQTGLYSDMPEKREIAFVSIYRVRERVEHLIGEEGILFKAVEIHEILSANRKGRIAWDIIGAPWEHIWRQVKEYSSQ